MALVFSASGTAWGEAAVAPALPNDVNPLPKDLASRMKNLVRSAEDFRGLKCLHGVPSGALGEEVLRKKMLEAFKDELPPEKMAYLEHSLKAFGFIKEELDLSKYYPELLTSQVGGFYDPKKQYLVIVQREGGLLGKEAKAKYGDDLAQKMEETVLVHELTHAIQDQHFDLKKFAIEDPLSDAGAARLALIEGDATLTMYNFFSGMKLEVVPGIEELMAGLTKDPKQMIDMTPDMPGAKEMSEAPAWFRDNLLFSYLQGYVFCINVKKLGGQKLLDHAFTKDPPKSTEQILHPEKWHTQRDDPIAIEWPDLSKDLAGYKKVSEAQLGEQSIKILLREASQNEASSAEAAAGWGGDRFGLYEKEKDRILLWITEWDTEADSKEFAKAAVALGKDWKIESSGAKRVIVTRGAVDVALAASLKEKLAAARAVAPENKNTEMALLLKDAGKKAGGEMDLGDLLNDPNMQKMLEKFMGGDDADKKDGDKAAGGLDVAEMLKNPAVQEMVKGMMTQDRPAGKATDDGQTYVNEQLGFSIKTPTSGENWKLDPKPPIPMASVSIVSPDNAVQIAVVNQPMPIAVPIETIGPMLEMAPKMMMADYKKISDSAIQTGKKKGYELQYEGTQQGAKIRTTLRVYLEGNAMIVVSAMCTKANWAANEKQINESLNSFSFIDKTEKKAAPAPKEAPAESLKE